MESRSWGLITGVALIAGAVLLGIALILGSGPETGDVATPTPLEQVAITPSPSVPPVPTPPGPSTYTVEAGDTLSAIAHAHDVPLDALIRANNITNPDLLQIGQTLIIPQPGVTEPLADISGEDPPDGIPPDEPVDVQVPTLPPSGPVRIEITDVAGVGNLAAERVVLENRGAMVSLEGWMLSTASGEAFVFPALTIFPDATVRVHTVHGEDTPRDLFWGRVEPAWQPGALVTLRNAEGDIVDTHIVPPP